MPQAYRHHSKPSCRHRAARNTSMSKLHVRLCLDAFLTVLLVLDMFYQLTGDTLHEIAGTIFFAAIIAHMAFSYRWMKAATRAAKNGKLKGKGKSSMVIAALLAITMAILIISSILISNLLATTGFNLLYGWYEAYATWSLLHTISAYTLCIIVTVHLGLHWAAIARAFRIPYDPERRAAVGAGVSAAVALGVYIIGSTGLNTINQSLADDVGANTPNTGGTSDSSNQSADSSTASTGSAIAAAGNSSSSAPSTATTTTTAAASGRCTLCRKNCSLSSPKCNRPYAAGLI